MTKEKYMALADFQTLWATKLKPWINGQKADRSDVAALADAIGYDTDYEFVDLGLPSGTLWAKCNVGATVETGYGNFYMYGKGSTQYNYGDTPYAGTENPLGPTKDTATVVMGAPWHMPTKEQIEELIANTTYTWETDFKGSGVNGGKFTAANGNYVFIPAAGYWPMGEHNNEGYSGACWSSTPDGSGLAYEMGVYEEEASVGRDDRDVGYSVRGVASKESLPLINVKAALALKADKAELPTFATPAECRAIVTGHS